MFDAVIWVIVLVIAWFIYKKSKKKVKSKRIGWALKFGKLEHKSARLLGVSIVITLLAIYFKVKQEYILYLVVINLFLWIVYWGSHRIEKKLYPSNFRFGRK